MDSPFVLAFKRRLDFLSCPITKDVDESWISELLFSPVAQRLSLLEWIIVKFDKSFSKVFENVTDDDLDSRVKRILGVLSPLGLCSHSDDDLILGYSSRVSQKNFMSLLVDLACAYHEADEIDWDKLQVKCSMLDRLVQQPLSAIYKKRLELIPPDIQKTCEGRCDSDSQKSRLTTSSPTPSPSRSVMTSASSHTSLVSLQEPPLQMIDFDSLKLEMKELDEKLEKIQREHELPEKRLTLRMSERGTCDAEALKVLLSELHESLTSFNNWYNNIKITQTAGYSNKPNLGPCFDAVQPLSDELNSFISSLAFLRRRFEEMVCITKDLPRNHDEQLVKMFSILNSLNKIYMESGVNPGLRVESDIPI